MNGITTAEDKRSLLERLLDGHAPAQLRPQPRSNLQLTPDFATFEARLLELERLGLAGLYFSSSEGTSRDRVRIGGRELVNLSGYNYLDLSGHPEVSRAAKDAIDRYGTSVSASRIASGERPLHRELERELASFLGTEDCLVLVGGFGTNEAAIGHLMGPGDLILMDSWIHASVQQGARQSGATVKTFPHNNYAALDRILAGLRTEHRNALVVIEGVYSMDGDIPDLPAFIEVKGRHRASLMVDEAHSLGVLGERGAGIGEHYGVERGEVDLWMGTLSKSLASCGGYLACSARLREYLAYTAPGFVYSVGISPANAAAALAALRVLRQEPERVAALRERAELFLSLCRRRGLDTGTSQGSAVVPVIVGDSRRCLDLYRHLYQEGFLALPIVHPAVPENAARVRCFISSAHSEGQLERAVDCIASFLGGQP
jgi:8-amino-7-oxononanoate synthase